MTEATHKHFFEPIGLAAERVALNLSKNVLHDIAPAPHGEHNVYAHSESLTGGIPIRDHIAGRPNAHNENKKDGHESPKPENGDDSEPRDDPGKEQKHGEEDPAAEFERIQTRLRFLNLLEAAFQRLRNKPK